MVRRVIALSILTFALGLVPSQAIAKYRNHAFKLQMRYGKIGSETTAIGLNVGAAFHTTDALWLGGIVPVAHVSGDNDSATTLGNLTAYGRYRLTRKAKSSSWIVASLSLPTSDSDGEGLLASVAMALYWFPDAGLYLPNTTTLRASYTHELFLGQTTVRLGAGLQVFRIDNIDDRVRLPVIISAHQRLSNKISLVGRLTNMALLSDEGDEDFLHALEAGALFHGIGRGNLELSVYYPLDELYRETLEVLGVSLQYKGRL